MASDALDAAAAAAVHPHRGGDPRRRDGRHLHHAPCTNRSRLTVSPQHGLPSVGRSQHNSKRLPGVIDNDGVIISERGHVLPRALGVLLAVIGGTLAGCYHAGPACPLRTARYTERAIAPSVSVPRSRSTCDRYIDSPHQCGRHGGRGARSGGRRDGRGLHVDDAPWIAASSWQPVPGAKRRDPPLAAYRRRRLRRLDTRRLHDATGMGAEVKDKSVCESKKQDVRSSLAPITSRFLRCNQ